MNNLDYDPVIARKRVYYEGADTLKPGYALCYNQDTTTNWWGYGEATLGAAKTEQSTTAEGEQNEGKWMRVEKPATANFRFFAGVVSQGQAAVTGPCFVDIDVPNGAIVAVWTDKSVTIGDGMYLENGQYTPINTGTTRIGTFMETVDRSSTAGLSLARIELPTVVYEKTVATVAATGPSALIWNDIPLSEIRDNPSAGIIYENDFLGPENLATGEGWTITQVNSGTLSLLAAEGGALHVDSGGNNASDDGVNAQLLNCRFLPKAGRTIAFEARVKMNDATDQYFIGLAATDTTLIAAGVLDDASDKVGFYHEAASTDNKISCVTARTSADDKTADVAANADATYMTVGFVIDGITTVDFYVNGALVESGALTANVPNAAMCLSVCAQVEATGADAEMDVDWVRITQYGERS